MATLGDILLLTTTYTEASGKYPHTVATHLDKETRELLGTVVNKLNRYSESHISTSALLRMLVLFSVDALQLREVLGFEDTLCAIPDKSSVKSNINSLSAIADVVGVSPKDLTHIDDVKGGHPLK